VIRHAACSTQHAVQRSTHKAQRIAAIMQRGENVLMWKCGAEFIPLEVGRMWEYWILGIMC